MALASTWWRLCFRCAPLLRTWRLPPLINHAYAIDLENYPPHLFHCVRCSNTPAMSLLDQMPVISLAKPILAKCLPMPWGPSSWIYSMGPMLWSQPSSRDSAKPERPTHGPWRWQRQWPPVVPRLRSYLFLKRTHLPVICDEICELTNGQSENTLWRDYRHGRLTSSNFKAVCTYSGSSMNNNVVKTVMG